MSAGHRVRCTCWWLDVSGIDRPPHSSYVRSFSEPDCPAHPTVDLEPAASYRVTGVQASLERVERRHFRWSHFWTFAAGCDGVAAGWNVGNGEWLAAGIFAACMVGALWLARLTR